MKKTMAVILGVALATPFLFPACVQMCHTTHFRVITGRVVNEMLIETDDGHLWGYDNEYPRGTHITVSFRTKGTESVLDDEIIDIKKL